MSRGFPPSSAYLGSDLPENKLMMPASAPRGGGPLAQGDTDEMPVDIEAGAPVGAPPLTNEITDALFPLAQQAGVDPADLEGPRPDENVSEWLERIKPLQDLLSTDGEITAFETMLDQAGVLGTTLGDDPGYGSIQQGVGTSSHAVGKPGAGSPPNPQPIPPDPSFAPDPTTGRGRY